MRPGPGHLRVLWTGAPTSSTSIRVSRTPVWYAPAADERGGRSTGRHPPRAQRHARGAAQGIQRDRRLPHPATAWAPTSRHAQSGRWRRRRVGRGQAKPAAAAPAALHLLPPGHQPWPWGRRRPQQRRLRHQQQRYTGSHCARGERHHAVPATQWLDRGATCCGLWGEEPGSVPHASSCKQAVEQQIVPAAASRLWKLGVCLLPSW